MKIELFTEIKKEKKRKGDKMDIDAAINALKLKVGDSTYSMYGSRNFSDGTCDCSGAVYYGLRKGGGSNFGYIPSTETLHTYLLQKLFFSLMLI